MSNLKKDAQGRSWNQRLREWTDIPQKVREIGGPSEYRQSMKEMRKLDSLLRNAARKMNRILPKARRSILLRRTDEAIDLLKKALEPTKDLKKTIEFVTSGSVTEDADDSNSAGIRDWYAETIGKGHDWLEKRKGKEGEAEKQKLLRSMYAKAEEFAKLFTDGLGRLGDYRSESDFDKYIELASFLADKRGELQKEVDTGLEQLSPAPVETTKEEPSKDEPVAEESKEPEATEGAETEPGETESGEAEPGETGPATDPSNPDVHTYFPGLTPFDEDPDVKRLEFEVDREEAQQGDLAPQTLQKVIELMMQGKGVSSKRLQSAYQKYKGTIEQLPEGVFYQGQQALQEGQSEGEAQNISDGNRRIAASLFLKASQMYEDDGREEESIKALALAERLLGIRRSGG